MDLQLGPADSGMKKHKSEQFRVQGLGLGVTSAILDGSYYMYSQPPPNTAVYDFSGPLQSRVWGSGL